MNRVRKLNHLNNLHPSITTTSKVIFLDRDGTLNTLVHYRDTDEWESPRTAADFVLLPGVLDALAEMQSLGWSYIVISNQPSYAKGKTSMADLEHVHNELIRQLNAHDISMMNSYYCYHHPKSIVPELAVTCECRKPGIGMLKQAAQTYQLDLDQCWFIGDQDSDIYCGQKAGCRTIQLDYTPSSNKRGQATPNTLCANLSDALAYIRTLSEIKKELS